LAADELPNWPTDSERNEAERRRSPWLLVVEGEYEVRAGLLQVTERGRDRTTREYFPMATPGVLGEFSRLPIGDEAALCTFASRWGLLGFDGPDTRRSLDVQGDPVAWVWAHLAGVQTVIRLHRLWRRRDSDGVLQAVKGQRISRANRAAFSNINGLLDRRQFVEAQDSLTQGLAPAAADDKTNWPGLSVIYGDRRRITFILYPQPRPGEEPLAIAWRIMSDVVNPNVRGVFPQMGRFVESASEAARVVQGWDSLLSVIYRHLFEIVVGGNVEECRECGTPFVQTDGRQRFCPPSLTRESPCAMRFHKREQRRRHDAGRGTST